MDELHIYLYGIVGEEITVSDIQSQIDQNPKATSLFVHISSPGGGVYEGWTIGNKISNLGMNSTALIEGYCGSIATYIALSCDKVLMSETGRFLIHKPTMGFEGNADEMREGAASLDRIQSDLAKKYQSKTKKDANIINGWMNAETEFTTDDAISAGFVDGFMKPMKAMAKFDIPKEIKQTKIIDKMEDKVTERVSALDAIINKGNELLNSLTNSLTKVKNQVTLQLEDGKKIYVFSEDGAIEGKRAVLANEDGTPTETPVPAGNHRLMDSRILVVGEGGIVSGVQEEETAPAESPEMKAMREENESLKAQIESMKNEGETLTAQNSELTTKMEETSGVVAQLIQEVNNLKKVTVGGGFTPTKAITQPQNKFKQEPVKTSGLDVWGAYVTKIAGIPVNKN